MTLSDKDLPTLLGEVERATPSDRIDYRDAVAAHGDLAVSALTPWLNDPRLVRFALRAIARVGSEMALATLVEARKGADGSIRAEIDTELRRYRQRGNPQQTDREYSTPDTRSHQQHDEWLAPEWVRRPLTTQDVPELYYIVALSNVPSIVERGLLSHERSRHCEIESIASSAVMRLRGDRRMTPDGRTLHSYANLYICARNPMMFVVTQRRPPESICVLRVAGEVMQLPGALISSGNAARHETRFAPFPRGLGLVDYDRVHAGSWNDPDPALKERHRAHKMAEVLVPDRIPPDSILGALVCDARAAEALRTAVAIDISVAPYVFFR